ncbi:hypothetical protein METBISCDRAFT_16968 [Metschnikowia bicuspidata]|uniref:DNA-directed DNA polymerase n=1 Tax=Metschnikowia bicuspidata TaxID=27322 RepID=A0A4P9ZBD1_9ASCO|nr:hypothetical protein METBISCDRAFT_16968 [Metschnikowia bicuspidata]
MEHLNKDIDTSERVQRVACSLKHTHDKLNHFALPNSARDYAHQFFSLYQQRLAMLKPRVDHETTRRWGNNTRQVNGKFIQHKPKILDITSGELCWVSGTIFSDMKHKLNILQEVERGTDDVLLQPPPKYLDAENEAVVMIEDESGRAILHNDALLRKSHLVTGCVVGVLGMEIQAGVLEIMEIVHPVPAPQQGAEERTAFPQEWIAFVSGLSVGRETALDLKIILLQQWLSGELGGSSDVGMARSISALVMVGNSIAEDEHEDTLDFSTTNNFGSKNTSKLSAESLAVFGLWLSEVLATVPVVVMPGDSDPCEVCLPQQPIHRALFGKNCAYVGSQSFSALTNPAWMELANGLRILATSGQNVNDIYKYGKNSPSLQLTLEIMELTLRWQVIVPTAPDTLYCYPYEDRDPFSLDETPNLYVVGNQCASGSRDIQLGPNSVTLVSVSAFLKTGEIVLVNTTTLETKTVRIVDGEKF